MRHKNHMKYLQILSSVCLKETKKYLNVFSFTFKTMTFFARLGIKLRGHF